MAQGILLALANEPALSQDLQELSIYCVSNMDGTGKCQRADTDEAFDCLMIPGSVIACRDKQKVRYECVQYGSIVANQSEFSCTPHVSSRINDKLFDGTHATPITRPDEALDPEPKDSGTSSNPTLVPKPRPTKPEERRPESNQEPSVLVTNPFVDTGRTAEPNTENNQTFRNDF